jgi:hypothetical protein
MSLSDRPAAASIENRTPADVGAANREARSDSFQVSQLDQTAEGARRKTK